MNQLLTEREIAAYTKGDSLIDRLRALLDHQKDNWELANKNYAALSSVETKKLKIDGIEIFLQHNPERVISTTADVEKDTVKHRNCILCEDQLPTDQRFIRYYKEYNFLVNPYPILNEHFTVVKTKHIPQAIQTYFNDLLLLSRDVGERYAVFYNGPRCGASLPEHLHFQMGTKKQLPALSMFNLIDRLKSRQIIETKKLKVWNIISLNRVMLILDSKEAIEILNFYSILDAILKKSYVGNEEPLLNILSFYENNRWKVVIFLRQNHRPSFYYKNDDEKIVVSPASIDMSGLVVVPRKEDVNKLNAEVVKKIYREVSLSKELSEYLILQLKNFYN